MAGLRRVCKPRLGLKPSGQMACLMSAGWGPGQQQVLHGRSYLPGGILSTYSDRAVYQATSTAAVTTECRQEWQLQCGRHCTPGKAALPPQPVSAGHSQVSLTLVVQVQVTAHDALDLLLDCRVAVAVLQPCHAADIDQWTVTR